MKSRVTIPLALGISLVLAVMAQLSAAAGQQGTTPSAAALSPDAVAAIQQRVQTFLRTLYAWGPDYQVKAGSVSPSGITDLYEVAVDVSFQGESESAIVYVTRDGRYMVRGEVNDMTADPFAAIRQKLTLDGYPSKGPANASIVIVEFGDFQCPSCRQLDRILRTFLPAHPEVRLVFKDFPLEAIHPWAMTAAIAGRCAFQHSPEAFWKLHDSIYDNQDTITPETAYARLTQLAAAAGVPSDGLPACMAAPQTAATVRESIDEGRALGVTSTPTSFVNGRRIIGPNEPLLHQFSSFTAPP
jgi:protein-disulfide isomerase